MERFDLDLEPRDEPIFDLNEDKLPELPKASVLERMKTYSNAQQLSYKSKLMKRVA